MIKKFIPTLRLWKLEPTKSHLDETKTETPWHGEYPLFAVQSVTGENWKRLKCTVKLHSLPKWQPVELPTLRILTKPHQDRIEDLTSHFVIASMEEGSGGGSNNLCNPFSPNMEVMNLMISISYRGPRLESIYSVWSLLIKAPVESTVNKQDSLESFCPELFFLSCYNTRHMPFARFGAIPVRMQSTYRSKLDLSSSLGNPFMLRPLYTEAWCMASILDRDHGGHLLPQQWETS